MQLPGLRVNFVDQMCPQFVVFALCSKDRHFSLHYSEDLEVAGSNRSCQLCIKSRADQRSTLPHVSSALTSKSHRKSDRALHYYKPYISFVIPGWIFSSLSEISFQTFSCVFTPSGLVTNALCVLLLFCVSEQASRYHATHKFEAAYFFRLHRLMKTP